MKSAICTFCEGHYHHGVAALTNSLYKNGFCGSIYVGYRGDLPPWADTAVDDVNLNWVNGKTFKVADGLELHFLPLTTNSHFANYKPNFMLELLKGPAKYSECMFYFDPDIVVVRSWSVFENWVDDHTIALCEDVNSPVAKYHPRRMEWRKYFAKVNMELSFKESIYANGGFIGLSRNDDSFLECWIKVQEAIALSIGGLDYAPFATGGKMLSKENSEDYSPFSKMDQDALNITVEAWNNGKVSFIGQEGMSFKHGARLMSHALGSPKPWKEKIIQNSVKGISPSLALKDYWQYVQEPILGHQNLTIWYKFFIIKMCIIIGRFYKKS
jgi:hypothetical protein